jgi:hypothetical protein
MVGPGKNVASVASVLPGTSCQVFPSDNVWNTDISRMPTTNFNFQYWAGTRTLRQGDRPELA